jgi:hypothetical protein
MWKRKNKNGSGCPEPFSLTRYREPLSYFFFFVAFFFAAAFFLVAIRMILPLHQSTCRT